MGKPDVTIPEPYDLEELLEAQVKMNRFDSENPWGTQRWERLPDGRFKMFQEINPDLQSAFDQNLGMANSPAPQFSADPALLAAGNQLMSGVMGRAGLGGFDGMSGKPQSQPAPKPQMQAPPPPAPPAAPPPAAGGQAPPPRAGGGGGGVARRVHIP